MLFLFNFAQHVHALRAEIDLARWRAESKRHEAERAAVETQFRVIKADMIDRGPLDADAVAECAALLRRLRAGDA
jgi:hypothetical protein